MRSFYIIANSEKDDTLKLSHEIADYLAERTHSDVVQVIGKKIVLYKEGKDNKKKIVLPE